MKKNLTLLAVIVCCAFACPSTNCFAQGRFLRALPMAVARATMQFDNLQENKSKYKINNDKLYTSRVFSVVNRTTITLMVSIYPSGKILVYISNIGE